MDELLCLFTQEVARKAGTAYVVIAAKNMTEAQRFASYVAVDGILLWGPCKIIKGARCSGEARILVDLPSGE